MVMTKLGLFCPGYNNRMQGHVRAHNVPGVVELERGTRNTKWEANCKHRLWNNHQSRDYHWQIYARMPFLTVSLGGHFYLCHWAAIFICVFGRHIFKCVHRVWKRNNPIRIHTIAGLLLREESRSTRCIMLFRALIVVIIIISTLIKQRS